MRNDLVKIQNISVGVTILLDHLKCNQAIHSRKKKLAICDTPKGANASAAVYSIVETSKANGLNVYTYLEYLLLYMPDTDWQNHPKDLDDLMPWNEDEQNECKC